MKRTPGLEVKLRVILTREEIGRIAFAALDGEAEWLGTIDEIYQGLDHSLCAQFLTEIVDGMRAAPN